MKKYLLCAACILLSCAVFAQAYPTSVSYNKMTKPGLMLLLPYTQEISEGTIIQKLKEIGYNAQTTGSLFWKKSKVNGYYLFRGVQLKDANGQPLDLYFNVDAKSRKEKQQSYISLLVSKGDEQFVSPETDSALFNASQRFLNGFVADGAAYKMDVDIHAQEGVVQAAEKKYTRLQDDERSLIKKIKDLEEDLRNNRQQQESQAKIIEAEKSKLDGLKLKK